MGKSAGAQKLRVTDYRLSTHWGISSAVDYIRGVWVNEKEVFKGIVNYVYPAQVSLLNLFGGVQKEGGVEGTMWMLPGHPDQVMPAPLATRLGRTPENCPAFRGVASVFFTGFIDRPREGWKWSTNSPLVAQTIWFDVTRMSKGLNPAYAQIDNDEAPEAPDTNPAHIIFEVMTDTVRGMGAPYSDFNIANWNEVAARLHFEKFGMSVKWMQESTIESFVNEILDHIQALIYLDPESGLWEITLLRDDGDEDDLPEINVDNAVLSAFDRKWFGETISQISVSYRTPVTGKADSVTVQLNALADIQGVVSDSRDYYGIRNRVLATQVAWRDLRSASAPLATLQASVDRSAWKWRPGRRVKVNWPEKELFGVICRILDADYGAPGDYDVGLSLTEDVFSLDRIDGAVSPGTGWINPSLPPEPMTDQLVFTLPAYMTLSPEFANRIDSLSYPEVIAAVLGYSDSPDATAFMLGDDEVTADGTILPATAGLKTLTERALLQETIGAQATTDMLFSTVNLARGPQINGFVLLGNGPETGQEIGLLTGYDAGQWTVQRGVLDTVPRPWPAGTPAWFLNPGSNFVDEKTLRSDGETVDYYLLTRTSLGQLDRAAAPPAVGTMTARPHLPLRPANVKVNGAAFGATVAVSSNNTITWATRNRELEDGQVVRWGAAAVAPEYRQRTIVAITLPDGTPLRTYRHLWTETQFDFPKAWFDRYTVLHAYVYAERDGFESLQKQHFILQGFAGDPGAAEPPLEPDAGVPPPPVNMPGLGVFTAVGGTLTTFEIGGGEIPALFVDGTAAARLADNPDAISLVVRYAAIQTAEQAVLDWITNPAVELTDHDTSIRITAVAPDQLYQVEVAYISRDNILGLFRNLGRHTTGALSTSKWGGREIGDFLELENRVTDAIGQLLQLANDRTLGAMREAEQRIQDTRDNLNRLTALAEIDLVAGSAIVRGDVRVEGEDETLAQTFTVLRAADADTAATVALEQLARVAGDAAEAAARILAVIELEDSLIVASLELRSYTDGEIASAVAGLATALDVDGKIASAVLELESYTDNEITQATANLATVTALNSAISTSQLSMQSYTNNRVSNAVAGLVTAATMNSAIAASRISIESYVDDEISQSTAGLVTATQLGTAISGAAITAQSKVDAYAAAAGATFASQSAFNGLVGTAGITANTVTGLVAQNNLARLSLMAQAAGGQPARMAIISDTYGSAIALDASEIWFGANTFFESSTQTLRTTINGIRYVEAWGPAFNGEQLTFWQGASSVPNGAETKANAIAWDDRYGGSFFGGETLAGPFDSGAPGPQVTLTKTWQNIAGPAYKTVRGGGTMLKQSVELYGQGQLDGEGLGYWQVEFQIISVVIGVQQEVVWNVTYGGVSNAVDPPFWGGGGYTESWDLYELSQNGPRQFYLQARIPPADSNTNFAYARNAQFAGRYFPY